MLFDLERARFISAEYERRVNVNSWQQALYADQQPQPAALVRLVDQGLLLVDRLVTAIWHWRQTVTHLVHSQ